MNATAADAEAVMQPCNECPWRRDATPGWLGPYTAEEWIALAHSDEPIACHQTIKHDESWDGANQCRGAASYRANVHKMPRDRTVIVGPYDTEHVFASRVEFREHHDLGAHYRDVMTAPLVLTAEDQDAVALLLHQGGRLMDRHEMRMRLLPWVQEHTIAATVMLDGSPGTRIVSHNEAVEELCDALGSVHEMDWPAIAQAVIDNDLDALRARLPAYLRDGPTPSIESLDELKPG